MGRRAVHPPTPPPVIARPPWCDPRYIMASSGWTYRVVTCPAGVVTRVCKADPTRWVLGFVQVTAAVTGTLFGATSSPLTEGTSLLSGRVDYWLTLMERGPLVCTEWNAIDAGGSTFGVFEVYTR